MPRSVIELGKRTAVMGILNVTPDSFSDGGSYFDHAAAIRRAYEIEQEGADILDIGGESSRPGSSAITLEEELRRVMPVLEGVRLQIPISIDTYRAEVARRAFDAGAQIVNDISAFRFDPQMAEVVNERKTAVILMHSRGNRDALHSQSPMVSPAEEIMKDLEKAARQVINRAAVVLDPGIGFGKRAEESLSVLRKIQAFSQLEYPLLVGTSRKSFIRKVVADRLWGTAATIAYSILNGVHIVRVHDVREIRALVDTLDVLNEC